MGATVARGRFAIGRTGGSSVIDVVVVLVVDDVVDVLLDVDVEATGGSVDRFSPLLSQPIITIPASASETNVFIAVSSRLSGLVGARNVAGGGRPVGIW